MRKVILYMAISLDGYIADINGGVSWLCGQDINNDSMDSYSKFIKNIDTVIMGYNTYNQVITELSPDNWVYKGLKSYVVTKKSLKSNKEINFINKDVCKLVKDLKIKEGKNIWICGGANIVNQLIKQNLIDIYHISIIPTILGNGIKLFNNIDNELKLKLLKTENYNGIVDLIYELR